VLVQCFAVQLSVAAALTLERALACLFDARTHAGTGFLDAAVQQLLGGQTLYFDVQINAVQQGTAELALVARHLFRRTAAAVAARAPKATGAGVHRSNQLELRREGGAVSRAGNGDVPSLQRLAQG